MAIDPKLVVWLVATFIAVVSLTQLMRKRQNSLLVKLQQYVEEQREWSKKRAKAARLARKLARDKAENEAQETPTGDNPDYNRYDKYSPSAAPEDAHQAQPAEKAA